MTLDERFWGKVAIAGPDECWLWQAATSGEGYGLFFFDGKARKAHRIAYELAVGGIPAGHVVDHVRARGCSSKSCVNPAHLEAVTHAENVVRGRAGALNRAKGSCAHGHPLSGANLYTTPDGRRMCRRCGARRQRKYAAAKRGAR